MPSSYSDASNRHSSHESPLNCDVTSYVPGQLGTGSFPWEESGTNSNGYAGQEPVEPEVVERCDQTIAPYKLFAMRLFAVVPMTLAGIAIYDAVLSDPVSDVAVVTDMSSYRSQRAGRTYVVEASGSRLYSNGVSPEFFGQLRIGDELRVKASPIRGIWHEAEIVGRLSSHGTYTSGFAIYTVAIALVLIIVPSISFAEPHIMLLWKHMPAAIGMTEVFATVMFICAGLKYAGII